MIGAIIGDIIGSPYEGKKIDSFDYNFPLFSEGSKFTDDSILTIATATSLLENIPYKESYLEVGRKYRDKGYGSSFAEWLDSKDPQPYNSWGNGSAMRVSPVGFYFNDIETILEEAKKSAEVTHNHPDAISGAQLIAFAIYYARIGKDKKEIEKTVSELFNCKFDKSVSFYRENYKFDISCKGTVIQAMTAFFESVDFESCIRNAVFMGGDTDTLACIAGSVADAYYTPEEISTSTVLHSLSLVPKEFVDVIANFHKEVVKRNEIKVK